MSVLARNVLICTVPAVILLSVFWFRRKKKIKTISISEKNEQTFSSEDYELKLNHSGEISSDAADTLSDASSFASPQNSEKSIRTNSIQLLSSPKDNTSLSSNISNNIPVNLSNRQEVDTYEMDSCIESNLLYKSKDIQFSDVLNNEVHNVESDNFDFNKSGNKSSVYEDCLKVSNVIKEYNKESVPITADSNLHKISKDNKSIEKSEVKNFHSHEDTAELMRLLGMNFHKNDKCKVERDSLRSNESNESVISSQGGDIEKLQIVETESNDSHSSVLDENSLSYVSDDSEYRPLVELKNKDSLSSVLDENSALSSFCEDSEKSINAESPIATIKSEAAAASEDSVSVDCADIDFTLTLVKDSIDHCADLLKSVTITETEMLDNVENQCSNSEEVDNSIQNLEKCLQETNDSIEKSSENSPVNPTDKFQELDSNINNQRHQTTLVSSSEALESCDSSTSESNFNPSSDKSSVLVLNSISKDSINQPNFENPCSSLLDNSVESSYVSTVENENHFHTQLETAKSPEIDPQISIMSIQGLLNNQATSRVEVAESSLNSAAWQIQDVQNEILNGHSNEAVNSIEEKDENSSNLFVYEFELPQDLCGRLIGKHGKHVKSIKDRSHANVYIKRHPYDPQLKVVVVEGNRADVTEALDIIRRKYPPSRYPMVTLVRTNVLNPPNVLPESLQLHLPEGASCDVILSSLVSAGHFFLQQPTHPTYPSLSTLDQCMINCYSQLDTPLLPNPVEPGVICAAPVLRGWYRAQAIHIYENEVDCELKFVDYGGFSTAPISSLRQIRSDFMSLPFQASECYLANVRPIDSSEWSAEATATFEELAQGQILQALLVEYAPDGIPCVHLYRVQGITNMFINKELVERGLAIWVNNSHWDPH